MKIRVSFKTAKGTPLWEEVEQVYLNNSKKTLTLHYNVKEPADRLLTLSINNGLELYRYADDNHIGITIPTSNIFAINYRE
jgi:hypothetical protein